MVLQFKYLILSFIILLFSFTTSAASNFTLSESSISNQIATFSYVKGMQLETAELTYRDSDTNNFSAIKLPGIAKYGNITLKDVTFNTMNQVWQISDGIRMNTISRDTYYIYDTQNNITFTVYNAWPTTITTNIESNDENGVTVNELIIAHEGIEITFQ